MMLSQIQTLFISVGTFIREWRMEKKCGAKMLQSILRFYTIIFLSRCRI